MGANTKALKNRIRSVDSTLHTTSAMGLVASSKMRRANQAMHSGKQYVAAVVYTDKICRHCNGCPELHIVISLNSPAKIINFSKFCITFALNV
jgi:hypothetical protein